jgi:NAD(P)-dependent dehydrogenase (short-subunit alcohol dehydrogenase family)
MVEARSNSWVCVVTGASEGIGKAVSFALLSAGNSVVMVSRSIDKLRRALDEFGQNEQRAFLISADVTNALEVENLVRVIIGRFERIDVLVNNVGGGLRRELIDTSNEEWQQLVALNLTSAFYTCRAVLPVMRQQKTGLIINIASRAGRIGEGAFAAYCAVKHGLIGLTKALADSEDKFGIRVNAVCPGPVATQRMIAQNLKLDCSGWITPQEVANAVLFLLTPSARTMQGQCLDLF